MRKTTRSETKKSHAGLAGIAPRHRKHRTMTLPIPITHTRPGQRTHNPLPRTATVPTRSTPPPPTSSTSHSPMHISPQPTANRIVALRQQPGNTTTTHRQSDHINSARNKTPIRHVTHTAGAPCQAPSTTRSAPAPPRSSEHDCSSGSRPTHPDQNAPHTPQAIPGRRHGRHPTRTRLPASFPGVSRDAEHPGQPRVPFEPYRATCHLDRTAVKH